MSFAEPEIVRRPFDKRFWLACFTLLAIFIGWAALRPQEPVLQNVPAPPFVIPEGCNPAEVKVDSKFKPKSRCFDEGYLIGNYKKYHFFESSGSRFLIRRYYRFRDMAVHLVCVADEQCQVNHIYNGVFKDLAPGT